MVGGRACFWPRFIDRYIYTFNTQIVGGGGYLNRGSAGCFEPGVLDILWFRAQKSWTIIRQAELDGG